MESSLRDNLRRLSQEKVLMASGQELLAQLIHGVSKKMGKEFRLFKRPQLKESLILTALTLNMSRAFWVVDSSHFFPPVIIE